MANILKNVFNCTAMSLAILSFSPANAAEANKENIRPGGESVTESPV